MAITILSGYPSPPGSKKESVVDVTGPASYGTLTFSSGQPASGGQLLSARQLGLSGLIESVECIAGGAISTTPYAVRAYLSPQTTGKGSASVYLMWFNAHTGAES